MENNTFNCPTESHKKSNMLSPQSSKENVIYITVQAFGNVHFNRGLPDLYNHI